MTVSSYPRNTPVPSSWYESDGDVVVPNFGVDFETESWLPDHIAGSTELAKEPLAAVERPRSLEEANTLDRPTRLRFLFETEGFYPASNDELNRMIAMSSTDKYPHRALMHFNEVYDHQRKHNAPNPTNALRSITRDFADYALAAQHDQHSVLGLRDDPNLRAANQQAGFMNDAKLGQLAADPQVRRALTIVARSREIQAFVDGAELDPLLKANLLDGSKDRQARVDLAFKSLRIREVARFLDSAAVQEAARFEYWVARLKEAQKHVRVRAISIGALRALHVYAAEDIK